MEEVSFDLPYPPSINHYWLAAGGGGRRISDRGRVFRDMVAVEVRLANSPKFSGDVSVSIRIYEPDRRKRDVDNGIKATLDALQHAGVFANDEQVVEIQVRKTRFPNDAPGRCAVTIRND